MIKVVRILALTALLQAIPGHAQTTSNTAGAYLTNPAVRLWYEETGRLSDNVAPPKQVTLWNTIVGEGDAEEHADNALFTIDVRSDGEQNIGLPLLLTATDAKGKVLGRRTVGNLLTSEAGNVTAALWVNDIGCAGTVVFAAQLGAAKRTVSLNFDCGE